MTLSVNAGSLQLANGQEKIPPLHHLVGVGVPEDMTLPAEMKTDKNNKLICSTCHGIKNIEDKDFKTVDKKSKDFLRGGPYQSIARLNTFCANCHQVNASDRLNIHKQLRSDGSIEEAHCEYCHQEIPDREKEYDWQEMKFKVPLSKLCVACHLFTPHYNVVEHAKEPNKKMRNRMENIQKQENMLLPLDEDGKVTCISCHSPHQKGLVDKSRPSAKQIAQGSLDDGIQYVSDHRWSAVVRKDKQKRFSNLIPALEQARKEGRFRKNKKLEELIHYEKIEKEILLRKAAKDGGLCESCHSFKD